MKMVWARSLVVAPLLLPACTLAMMQQMSDPTEAEEPEHVSWPEAEALAAQASADFTGRSNGSVLATYLPKRGWNQQWNEERGKVERSAGLWLFWRRQGGAVVKGAKGEDGVCFRHSCSLVQQRATDGWEAPFLDCDDYDQQKVTCKSVQRFASLGGPGTRPRRATEARAAPAHTPPFGTYRGNLASTILSKGKEQKGTAASDIILVDRGSGQVEVRSGICRFKAELSGKRIQMLAGQSCEAGGAEIRDVKGVFVLMPDDKLQVSLEMIMKARGDTAKARSSGVLQLDRRMSSQSP